MSVFPKILRYAWTGGKKLLAGVRFQFKSEVGKNAARILADEVADTAVLKAAMDNEMVRLGVLSPGGKILLKKPNLDNLLLTLDKGPHHANDTVRPIAEGLRNALDDAWKQVKDVGGTAKTSHWELKEGGILKKIDSWAEIGKQENYFPHFLKRDYAEAFIRDGDKAFRHAAKEKKNYDIFSNTVKYDEADLNYLTEFTKKRMALKEGDINAFNPKTVKAIQRLVEQSKRGGKEISPGQAIATLRDRGINQINSPFSVLRRGRKLNLVEDAYETNPVVALETYFRGWSKQVAHQKAWGAKNEKWFDTLNRMKAEGNLDEIKAFERLSEYIDGSAEFKYSSQEWRKFAKGFSEIEVMTKIGLGTAFIPNLTQIFISTIPKVGYLKGMQAGLKAFTKEGREIARGTGIGGRKFLAMNMMAGMPDDYAASGVLGKMMTHHPGMDLFQGINKWNNVYSALAGEIYLKDMYKKALKGSKGALEALKRYGIGIDAPLDKKTLQKGMYRFATDMQLQRDVLADPLWMNDPRFRLLALFKRFGLRQTAMVYDHIINDAIIKPMQRGQAPNVKPLLMLLSHGVAGGYFVTGAKEMLRENVFGAPPYDAENVSMLKSGLFAFAQSGAFGMVGDIVGRMDNFTAHEIIEGAADNLYFSLTPIALGEAFGIPGNRAYPGIPELARDLAVDWAEYGFDVGTQKQLPNWMKKISPLGAYPAAKIRADQKNKEARQKFLKNLYGG